MLRKCTYQVSKKYVYIKNTCTCKKWWKCLSLGSKMVKIGLKVKNHLSLFKTDK